MLVWQSHGTAVVCIKIDRIRWGIVSRHVHMHGKLSFTTYAAASSRITHDAILHVVATPHLSNDVSLVGASSIRPSPHSGLARKSNSPTDIGDRDNQ